MICKKYREKGFEIVQRTAGSHSPIDIIAINKDTKEIVLIQSKPDNFSIRESEKILADLDWLNDTFCCYVELI